MKSKKKFILDTLSLVLLILCIIVYQSREDDGENIIKNEQQQEEKKHRLVQHRHYQKNKLHSVNVSNNLKQKIIQCNTTILALEFQLQQCKLSRPCHFNPQKNKNTIIRDFHTLRFPLFHPLLEIGFHIQKTITRGGPIYMQYLDKSYITMTKSWICNVIPFETILPRTIFVTTDQIAHDALVEFSHSVLRRVLPLLNVILIPFIPHTANGKDLDYGTLQYYDMMLFRSGIDWQLLKNGIEFMTIEADAVWHQDPSSIIFSTPGDIITGNDRPPGEIPLVSHGFSLYRSNPRVVEFLLTLLVKQEENFGSIGDSGNEQHIMTNLLQNEFHDLQVTFLNQNQFVNGEQFEDLNCPHCVVRQNNWVVGNQNKIERAKGMKFWYLDDDDEDEGGCI
jgi:hypothetical protein